MNLSSLWDWDKQKLTANIDTVPKHLSDDHTEFVGLASRTVAAEPQNIEQAAAPASSTNKIKKMARTQSTHMMMETVDPSVNLSLGERNINKQFLTPVRKLPLRRRLNKKLEHLNTQGVSQAQLNPNSGYDVSDAPSKRNNRSRPKLQSIQMQVPTRTPTEPEIHPSLMLNNSDYSGDLFGTRGNYVDGMVYRSRMLKKMGGAELPPAREPEPENVAVADEGLEEALRAEERQALESIAAAEAAEAEAATSRKTKNKSSEFDGDEDEDEDGATDANSKRFEGKQRCAATLRNWSFYEENRERMVREGAVQALMKLATVPDKKTRGYCASAFQNLSSHPGLRAQIVDQGGAHVIVELCTTTDTTLVSMDIIRDCTAALCNLSCLEGAESRLVEDGLVACAQARERCSCRCGDSAR